METNIITLPIPEYALSYLINNDGSGISEEDKQIIDDWLSEQDNLSHIDVIDEESEFSWNPVFGQPCNTLDCNCIYKL